MSLAEQMMAAQTAAAEMTPPPASPASETQTQTTAQAAPTEAPTETPAAESAPTPPPYEQLLAIQQELAQAQAAQAAAQQPEVPVDPMTELEQQLSTLDQLQMAVAQNDPQVVKMLEQKFGIPENADAFARAQYVRLGLTAIILEKRTAYQQMTFERQMAALQQQAIVAPQQERQEQEILGLLNQHGLATQAGLVAVVPHYQAVRAAGGTHQQGLQAMNAAIQLVKPAFAPPAPPAPAPQTPPNTPVRVSSLAQIQAARGGAAPTNTVPAAQRLASLFKSGRPT